MEGEVRYVKFALAYISLNFAAALEYRAAFIAQALGMLLNDAAFCIFWLLFFDRFPSVGGWGMRDVAMVWAVAATSVGLAVALFGNCVRLATIVMEGQLDYYLGHPKNVLAHVLVSRMGLAGWGDVAFGLLAFAVFGPHDPASVSLYVLLVLTSTITFVAYMVIAGSLAFFVGSADSASFQAQQAVVNFSLYPGSMYRGWLQLVMFTIVPAGFISHIPVELLRSFDISRMLLLLGIAAFSTLLAASVFQIGLRRYESGNLIALRG
jgi:ABC-2 type transport system permease protein